MQQTTRSPPGYHRLARVECYRRGALPFHRSLVVTASLMVGVGGACSVFPNEAVLPSRDATDAGGASDETLVEASEGGAATAGEGEAGQASSGGNSSPSIPAGGIGGAAPAEAGGQADVGCVDREVQAVPVDADTWIDAAKANARHGDTEQLAVMSGTDERRALFALTVPATPSGAKLRRAVFVLHLEANEDVAMVERELAVHRLNRTFNAERASWRRWDKGNQWATLGGDFGPELATARLPMGTASGPVLFDVTGSISEVAESKTPPSLGLIVLEATVASSVSVSLVFASADSATSPAHVPALRLVYCDP